MALQQKISAEKNKNKIGSEVKVLIDRVDAHNYYGRTEQDSPEVDNEVIIPSNEMHLRVGDFYKVINDRVSNIKNMYEEQISFLEQNIHMNLIFVLLIYLK